MSKKRDIEIAVASATSHDVSLIKIRGVYYWAVPISRPVNQKHPLDSAIETCTHNTNLNGSIDSWVNNFKGVAGTVTGNDGETGA